MKAPYPEIAKTAKSVANVIEEEESQFLGVVEKGLSEVRETASKRPARPAPAKSPATTRSTCIRRTAS